MAFDPRGVGGSRPALTCVAQGGTSLGTSYAEQFARRVRAMVLDGAVDPSLDWRYVR
ncbi:hypothetical protein [Streptomyces sp. NPDC094032]|uniref:hypothetical protein n=1 Tax=Streptomyces sp. NPDC094032 TaxID=3155308 RepID=UPI0033174CEF